MPVTAMKRNFLLLLCLIALHALPAVAQPFNNEWIDYNKAYYKFSITAPGLCRISKATLDAAGLGNTPAENLQLWHNGKVVPVYTSAATGTLPAGGYIEFWGEQNDGLPDTALYLQPAYQLSTASSIIHSQSVYFLTVNANPAANAHYTNVANNLGGTLPPAETVFRYRHRLDFAEQLYAGKAIITTEPLNSSSYDIGEILGTTAIRLNTPYNTQPVNLYTAGTGTASLEVGYATEYNTYTNRTFSISVNNTVLYSQNSTDYKSFVVPGINVPVSLLGSSTTFGFSVTNTPYPDDAATVAYLQLSYDRQYNFGGASSFRFTLPASATDRLLDIANFNHSGVAPVLYDLSSGQRFTGNISTGNVRFLLPAAAFERNLILSTTAAPTAIATLTQRNFIRYNSPALQGNYLIISNKALMTTAGNAVEQYRAYRSSTAGGTYNAKIYDVDELEDQFAFGIHRHPLSVKNFLRYARSTFSSPPLACFLVGRAVTYDAFLLNQGNSSAEALNLVPTFGFPASDVLLAADGRTAIQQTPIGRLAAIRESEILDYLAKVKEYEAQQASDTHNIATKAWKKNVVQIVGASDYNDAYWSTWMNNYRGIIADTSYGAKVTLYNRSSGPITADVNDRLTRQFNEGIGLLHYLGHSGTGHLDFNINDPAQYNNQGKYPIMFINGCSNGNFYSFDATRFTSKNSISDKYVFTPQKGTVAFIGTTSFGLDNVLNQYAMAFMTNITRAGYNSTLAENLKASEQKLIADNVSGEFFTRMHAEQMNLHGDPVLRLNNLRQPDYTVDSFQVKLPAFVSVADRSVSGKVYFNNLGKALRDSVGIAIVRVHPDGKADTLVNRYFNPGLRNQDSVSFTATIVANRDKGTNKIIASIDYRDQFNELSETNNVLEQPFEISEEEIRPVYPANFAIINTNTGKLSASTANPTGTFTGYTFQIDTTTLFNSPLKITGTVSSAGGIIEFDPGMVYRDSTVYYWRVTPSNRPDNWRTFSFTYLNGTGTGFSQSHVYQHTQSVVSNIAMDSSTRRWRFDSTRNDLRIYHSIFPYATDPTDFSIDLNGVRIGSSACVGHSFMFNVFDGKTLQPYYNQTVPSTTAGAVNGGFMGSGGICGDEKNYNFEFFCNSLAGRRTIRDFMDWIPDGAIVSLRFWQENDYPYNPESQLATWINDQATDGTNTLYNRLKAAGFAGIDDYTFFRTWAFVYRKGSAYPAPKWAFTPDQFSKLILGFGVSSAQTGGTIQSPVFGPAKSWSALQWRGAVTDTADRYGVQVTGIRKDGTAAALFSLDKTQQDLDLSQVDPVVYPYLQLSMFNRDSLYLTPYQLNRWRLYGTPAPEGAVAPNLLFRLTDTVKLRPVVNPDTLQLRVAFKNVGKTAFDSIRVTLALIDTLGNTYPLPVRKARPLAAGDTAVIFLDYPVPQGSLAPGLYNLYLMVNPDYDQAEQYLYNNFLYKQVLLRNESSLPVTITRFNATRYQSVVKTEWQTEQEHNVRWYEVEHSTDGIHFTLAGTVPATQAADYNFIHNQPVKGKNYYRLKITDADNSYRYTAARLVVMESGTVVTVYPNPATSLLNISVSRRDGRSSTATLTDLQGRVIRQENFTGTLQLPVATLAKGTYLVLVDDGTELRSFKVVKE